MDPANTSTTHPNYTRTRNASTTIAMIIVVAATEETCLHATWVPRPRGRGTTTRKQRCGWCQQYSCNDATVLLTIHPHVAGVGPLAVVNTPELRTV
jgi:hypothetical protein